MSTLVPDTKQLSWQLAIQAIANSTSNHLWYIPLLPTSFKRRLKRSFVRSVLPRTPFAMSKLDQESHRKCLGFEKIMPLAFAQQFSSRGRFFSVNCRHYVFGDNFNCDLCVLMVTIHVFPSESFDIWPNELLSKIHENGYFLTYKHVCFSNRSVDDFQVIENFE